MNERHEHFELLERMAVFGGTRDETIAFLLRRARLVEKGRGEYFFREGEEGRSMFVMQRGRAAVLKTWKGHEYLLRYSGVGDCVGEMSLLDLGPRSASVRAVEPAAALEIFTADLHQLYEKDPGQFALIHMNMGREVSRRLREANRHLFEARVEAGTVDGHFDLG